MTISKVIFSGYYQTSSTIGTTVFIFEFAN